MSDACPRPVGACPLLSLACCYAGIVETGGERAGHVPGGVGSVPGEGLFSTTPAQLSDSQCLWEGQQDSLGLLHVELPRNRNGEVTSFCCCHKQDALCVDGTDALSSVAVRGLARAGRSWPGTFPQGWWSATWRSEDMEAEGLFTAS